MVGKTTIIRRRSERPPREMNQILKDAERMIVSWGRRVGQAGNPEDLGQYRSLIKAMRQGEALAVAGFREQGYTDAQIAAGAGCSKRNVLRRWPRNR